MGPTRLLSAAIEVANANTKAAFSFRHEYEKDPLKITNVPFWIPCISLEVPIAILLDPCENVHSFGYDAEAKYSQLAEDDKHRDWYFFKSFITSLFENKGSFIELNLVDIHDRELPALMVFSNVIRCMKNHVLEYLERHLLVTNEDIQWVLTIPVASNSLLRDFITAAAYKAGIERNQITLVEEQVAAFLNFQYLLEYKLKIGKCPPGDKCLLLNIKDDRVDFTAIEIEHERFIKEIFHRSDKTIGEFKLRQAFYKMLANIVGQSTIQELKEDSDLKEMYRDFLCKPFKDIQKYNLRIAVVLREMCDMHTAIQESCYADKMRLCSDILMINPDVIFDIFHTFISGISDCIKQTLKQPFCDDTKTVMLLGRVSKRLHHHIQSAFPHMTVIVDKCLDLEVVKGAVLYGHRAIGYTRSESCHLTTSWSDTLEPACQLLEENKLLREELKQQTEKCNLLQEQIEAFKQASTKGPRRDIETTGAQKPVESYVELCDQIRPNKIAEKYSELYDDEWTDSLEDCVENGVSERGAMDILLNILLEANAFCKEKCIELSDPNTYFKEVVGDKNILQRETLPPRCEKLAKELLMEASRKIAPQIENTFVKMKKSQIQRYGVNMERFCRKCAEVTWYMNVLIPPVQFEELPFRKTEIDLNNYRLYSGNGDILDFVVWPACKIAEHDCLLVKGVVEPIKPTV